MKQFDAPGKLFRLEPNRHWEKYDGKTVEFILDLDGKLLLLTGRFITHAEPEFECVDIHYAGRIAPYDPPYGCYVFHLSKAHLRSTVATDQSGSNKADFLMERPLVPRESVRSRSGDWAAPLPSGLKRSADQKAA
jgi:hypothetical protein